jgi:hypothetical protein
MKALATLLLLLLFFAPSQQAEKTALLCHKWKQCGQKTAGEKYTAIPKEMDALAEKYVFNSNGSYENEISILKSKGTWLFNKTLTEIVIDMKELNGQALTSDGKTILTIIKLTKDTLVLGKRSYHMGKGFGRDDKYYVRQDN